MGEFVAPHLDRPDFVRLILSGGDGIGQPWRKAVLRYVQLRDGLRLQVVTYDAHRSHTQNVGGTNADLVHEVLASPFRNAVVELRDTTLEARVSKRGKVLQRTTRCLEPRDVEAGHDRQKNRLVPADAQFLDVLGVSSGGLIKPSRQAKFRQVNEFVRVLDATRCAQELTSTEPVHVVDIGCGNAYLTFAVYHYFTHVRDVRCTLLGIDRDPRSNEVGPEWNDSVGRA
jgi:hypothetical protein